MTAAKSKWTVPDLIYLSTAELTGVYNLCAQNSSYASGHRRSLLSFWLDKTAIIEKYCKTQFGNSYTELME